MKPPMILIIVVLLCLAFSSPAAPVSAEKAKTAVKAWLKADPTPLQERLSPELKEVREFKGQDGTLLYYVVDLAPAGFVVLSADDLIEPIIAFSSTGKFDPSEATPLGALVSRDLPGRMAKARASTKAEGALLKAKNKWKNFEDVDRTGTLEPLGFGTVSDMRVQPIVQSRWSQDTAPSGVACYNYYTPPYASGNSNNYPCGCVATAMAQLMRYYQHPATGVGTASFFITVSGITQSRSLRGGNGTGGAYDWANMPLIVNSPTPLQCQAIGALTHDAGVAVNAEYTFSETAAYMSDSQTALLQTFGYSNARLGQNYGANIGPGLNGMVNPNLDARFPVLFGVSTSFGEGHAIICDGYGYNVSTLYHHLNLGWSGADDAWYALPTIDTTYYYFNVVDEAIYNIYTNGTGEIISGRVVTTNGLPISGVNVTATRTSGGSYSAVTDTNGIYALAKIPSGSSYSITVSKAGYKNATQSYSTGTSADYYQTSGNVWGANFTLSPGSSGSPTIDQQPLSLTVPAGSNLTFRVRASGVSPLHFQWRWNGTNVSGATSSNLTLTAVTRSQAGAYQVVITNIYGAVTSAVANLNIYMEVHHFAWDLIDSPQTVTTPFTVRLTALDPADQVITNYSGRVNLSGIENTFILGEVVHSRTRTAGSYTDGYTFTPNTNITVTHVRHYYGEKVSIWTDTGVPLVSRPVNSLTGTWRETELTNPVTLYAGTRYRLGTYSTNSLGYCRTDLPSSLSHLTINSSCRSPGDQCPGNFDSYRYYLVDLRYEASTPITPTNSGNFVRGVWSGDVSVPITTSNFVLWAEDAYGNSGRSNPFNVEAEALNPIIPSGSIQVLNGQFQMRLTNLSPARVLVVETSTNLTNWAAVYTNATPGTGFLYSDPKSSNYLHRFYRALER